MRHERLASIWFPRPSALARHSWNCFFHAIQGEKGLFRFSRMWVPERGVRSLFKEPFSTDPLWFTGVACSGELFHFINDELWRRHARNKAIMMMCAYARMFLSCRCRARPFSLFLFSENSRNFQQILSTNTFYRALKEEKLSACRLIEKSTRSHRHPFRK